MQSKDSRVLSAMAAAAVVTGLSLPASAAPLLGPGDYVRAVDSDVLAPSSGYPDPNEAPAKAIDGNATGSKYLNFGGRGTGFIVTPTDPAAIGSFVLTTGNDADGRDPTAYLLFGTNQPIVSADNSTGLGEAWTFIQKGRLSPPGGDPGRNSAFPTVNVAGSGTFSSYKLFFPTLRDLNDPNMQINEAQFFTGANATGTPILAAGNAIKAIDAPVSQSAFPENENPQDAVDGDAGSKYLNFGKANSGLIVTPAAGKSVVTGLKITTANDVDQRDPVAFAIYGTNDSAAGLDDTDGTEANWTLIHSGPLDAPLARQTEGALATFANTGEYTSYKILFTALRDAGAVDSMQVAEIQLEGTLVPEPGTLGLAGVALAGLALRRRRA